MILLVAALVVPGNNPNLDEALDQFNSQIALRRGGGGQLAEAVLSILIFPLIPQETPSPPKKELIRTLRLLPELQSYEEAILVRSLRA